MAAEPITLFGPRVDPAAVPAALRPLGTFKISGGPHDWREIHVSIDAKRSLVFNHDPGYYALPGWERQRTGMLGYFARFPAFRRKRDIANVIGSFRFAIAVACKPELDMDDPHDPRRHAILLVARALGACIFQPSCLRDSSGHCLISADEDVEEHEAKACPPAEDRVATRTLCLGAMAARGLLEQEDARQPAVTRNHQRLLEWCETLRLREELEPEETHVLKARPGTLETQQALNACWRFEGLAVLLWSLERVKLPPYDEVASADDLLRACGFLDVKAAQEVKRSKLRPTADLVRLSRQLLTIHWRLREFGLRAKTMDFHAFVAEATFAPLDASGCRFLDRDLAVGNLPIAAADPEIVERTTSAIMERHQAINWLLGRSPVYSQTDTPT